MHLYYAIQFEFTVYTLYESSIEIQLYVQIHRLRKRRWDFLLFTTLMVKLIGHKMWLDNQVHVDDDVALYFIGNYNFN